MIELRWALAGLGIAFLVVLALWEWRRSRRRNLQSSATENTPEPVQPARPRRVEPGIDGWNARAAQQGDERFDVPTIHPVGPVSVAVATEQAVDVPAAARPRTPDPMPEAEPGPAPGPAPSSVVIKWPPERTDHVIGLRVVGEAGPVAGRRLRNALEASGFVAGPQSIYHLVNADGVVLASAANLVRPGVLDPATMDAQEFRGTHLFCVLPGPAPATQMLDDLVATARALAGRLDGIVQDDRGAALDAARLEQIRQSLPAEGTDGDGNTP